LLKSGPCPKISPGGIVASGSSRAVLTIIGSGFGYCVLKSQPFGSVAHASYQSLRYGGPEMMLCGSTAVSFHIRSNFILNAATICGSLVNISESSS
jgi:hypothetical protein